MKRLIRATSVKDWDYKKENSIVDPSYLESQLPNSMRYKEWHLEPKRADESTIVFTWITQGEVTDEGYMYIEHYADQIADDLRYYYEDAKTLEVEIYQKDYRNDKTKWHTFSQPIR